MCQLYLGDFYTSNKAKEREPYAPFLLNLNHISFCTEFLQNASVLPISNTIGGRSDSNGFGMQKQRLPVYIFQGNQKSFLGPKNIYRQFELMV
jgi:hypothetical protein